MHLQITLNIPLSHGFKKKYYHCEISFQKSSYFISYSSDTQALITATLAHYFSHLNLTLSIDQRIQIILFCIATCIWQRCSSLSPSSHNALPHLSHLCLSPRQSAEHRALPSPELLSVQTGDVSQFLEHNSAANS